MLGAFKTLKDLKDLKCPKMPSVRVRLYLSGLNQMLHWRITLETLAASFLH